MTILIFIRCTQDGCDTTSPVDAQSVIEARQEARMNGWETIRHYDRERRKWMITDQCPGHAQQGAVQPAPTEGRIPPELCFCAHRCPSRVHDISTGERAVFDWCGHDRLGHRMANIFIREGLGTVQAVTSAYWEDVLDLRGFGGVCFTRWELFTKEGQGNAA